MNPLVGIETFSNRFKGSIQPFCVKSYRHPSMPDYLDVSGSRVFKHINSPFDRFSFGSYIEFRAIDNITAFFGRREFGRDFNLSHGKGSYGERKSRGSMDNDEPSPCP